MAKKKVDSKAKIAQAALRCFIENGVVGTSFKEIAKAAGVHQPLISYYFKSFEELFAAVTGILLADLKAESIKAIESHPSDPYLALLEYAEIPLKWAKKKPEYAPIWTFFYHMASYHDFFQSMNNGIRKEGRDRITLLLFQIQEKRELKLKAGQTIAELAYAIHAQITGELVMAVTEKQNLSKAIKLCRKSVEIVVQGGFTGFK